MTAPYPGIYTRPKKRWGALETVIAAAAVILVAAAAVLVWYLLKPSSSIGAPSRQAVQAQAITGAQELTPGVVKVTCVMPASWTPGNTFKCYAYGSSGRELEQMSGTVLPDEGARWQMNTTWVVL
jgi:hypothetical protein